jgi:AraC family transcriptional regulator of adaptative response / DNA-3-methyladenine glycosylase II
VARALARIDAGALEAQSQEALARSLGVSGRHLRRALQAELGVSASQLVATRRLSLAKQLLHDTSLPVTRIAHESGFGSVRRFNAAFRAAFDRPPTALRRGPGGRCGELALTLGFRPPFDWDAMLGFLALRAVPGVELVRDEAYFRTVRLRRHQGSVRVALAPTGRALLVQASAGLSGVLLGLAARLNRLFDLRARPDLIAEHLAQDPLLERSVRQRPWQRVVGAFDGHELAVRAVLGQQVSVAAARTLALRLVSRFGTPIETGHPELTHGFPGAPMLAAKSPLELSHIGIPMARAATLVSLSSLFQRRPEAFEPGADPAEALALLRSVRGVGAWTAEYIAMRALGWPDAFPAGDLGVQKALGGVKPRAATERAERWRPWRAYAVMHLWQGAA